MSVKEDIAEIKAAIEQAENDQIQARRSLNRLHNLLADKLAVHGERLGLTEDEIVVAGGGVNK